MEPTSSQGRSIGGYEILRGLKRGGMGEVLLGRRVGAHGFERLVAIKTIRADMAEEQGLQQMFQDEARLMARLHHPGVAQVYDFGSEGDLLYLVLEYVSGISFSQLRALSPPSLVSARAVAEACRGLHAAHELKDEAGKLLGLVHRDISPGNLMLSFEGAVKVLDFGIAWTGARVTPQTEFGTVKGKPPYMSPEQLKGEPLDRRSDVFSICLVLHELLTGERVFDFGSAYEVASALISGSIPSPSRGENTLARGLEEVVMRGLALDPEARFPSALALSEALDGVISEAKGESLESFCVRKLAPQRAREQALVQMALAKSGGPSVADSGQVGRPEGLNTVLLDSGDGKKEATSATSAPTVAGLPEAKVSAVAATAPTRVDEPAPAVDRPRRRATFVAAFVLLAALASLAVLWKMSSRPSASSGGPAVADGATRLPDAAGEDSAAEISDTMASAPSVDTRPRPDARRRSRPKAPKKRRVLPPAAKRPKRKAQPPDAAPEAAPGFLTVGATPYALVRLDGRDLGTTPLVKRRIPAGRHLIELLDPRSRALRLKRVVEIVSGKHRRVVLP